MDFVLKGGDYNEGPVYCWKKTIEQCVAALIVLTNALEEEFTTVEDNIKDVYDENFKLDGLFQ